jgi:hypothetical protein
MLTTQQKTGLQEQIKANKHQVFILSIKHMDAIVQSSRKSESLQIKERWADIRKSAEFGSSWYASADDVRTLSKLVGDLGGFGAKVSVKNYGGRAHIILKGYPGLRRILTGTKYGVRNPKVVTMGLGRAGAVHAARAGGILSVVLMTGYRVIDYFLTDRQTLSHLVGNLATDIVKVGIVTGASIAAGILFSTYFVLAVGPILVVVFVGIIGSLSLTSLDEKYEITTSVVKGLDDLEKATKSGLKSAGQGVQKSIDKTLNATIDYIIDSATRVIIDTAKHRLDDFLLARPRLY